MDSKGVDEWRSEFSKWEREFDRIGADKYLRGGFSTRDPRVTKELVFAALRATPSGGGTAAFEQTLRAMLDPEANGSRE